MQQGEDGRPACSRGEYDGRPACSRGEDGLPARSQGEDIRPARSRGEDGRPARSRGEDGQPACSRGEDGRPACSRGEDGQPACSRGEDGRVTCSQGEDNPSYYSQAGVNIPSTDEGNDINTFSQGGNELPAYVLVEDNIPLSISEDDIRLSLVEDGPPSYSEAEQLDQLPSYTQLGVARTKIGSHILIFEKKAVKFKTFRT